MNDTMNNIPQITQSDIVDVLRLHYFGMSCKWAPMFHSAPGLAKSAQHATAAKLIANELGRDDFIFYVLRAVHHDPVDVRGIPYTDVVEGRDLDGRVTRWAAADFIDQLTVPGAVGLFFLDELMQASPATRQALAPVILDREIGGREISDGILVTAASNRAGDRAGVGRMESNLRNRFVHYDVSADFEGWKAYALKTDIAPIVIAYLGYQTEALHAFDPQSSDYAFATLRSWEMVSDICKSGGPRKLIQTAIHGAVGSGHAAAFYGFMETWTQRNDPDAVIKDPDAFDPPVTNLAALHAECISLSMRIGKNGEHFPAIMRYVSRMPADFCQMFLRDATTRDPLLMDTPEFTDWCLANADMLRDFKAADLS